MQDDFEQKEIALPESAEGILVVEQKTLQKEQVPEADFLSATGRDGPKNETKTVAEEPAMQTLESAEPPAEFFAIAETAEVEEEKAEAFEPAEVVEEVEAEVPAEVVEEVIEAEVPAEVVEEAEETETAEVAEEVIEAEVPAEPKEEETETAEVVEEVEAEAPAEVVEEVEAEAPAEVVEEVEAEAPAEVVEEVIEAEVPAEPIEEAEETETAEIVEEVEAEAPAEPIEEVEAEVPAEVVEEVEAEVPAEVVEEVEETEPAEEVIEAEVPAEPIEEEIEAEVPAEVAEEVEAETPTEVVEEVEAEEPAEPEEVAEEAEEVPAELIEEVEETETVEETAEETAEPEETVEETAEPEETVEETLTEEQLAEQAADLEAEEISALAGFSINRDSFGRDILERNFVNILTMQKNAVKKYYSRIKNAIFAYQGAKTNYDGVCELVRVGADVVCRFAILDGHIVLSLALPCDAVDNAVYPYSVLDEATEPVSTLKISVTVEDKASFTRAEQLIGLMMKQRKIKRSASGNMVAYSEKYPLNPNAVLAGDEDKPPVDGQYVGAEWENITGGVLQEIMEEADVARPKEDVLKGKEELEVRRQTATTVKGAMALQEPIVYFYDVAVDKDNNPAYLYVQQVLNDKFLGKLLPEMYVAVAEGSDKIEQLNLLAIQMVAEDCNRYPELTFVVPLSFRMLLKPEIVQKVVDNMKTEHNNMMFALDTVFLEPLGEVGKAAVATLRVNGAKILLDNSENAGMRALTDYEFDVLRFDARFYKDTDKKQTAHLAMITGFAKTLGIPTAVFRVETVKDATYFISKGVEIVEGVVVSEPKRIILNAVKERKKLPQVR